MKIVVGLGNPGRQYEETRHNVGWMVLDRVADRAGSAGRAKARDAAAVVRGRYGDLDLVLVKPTTYMNLSGIAVRKVLARERVPLVGPAGRRRRLRLPFGKLRMREAGSAGGAQRPALDRRRDGDAGVRAAARRHRRADAQQRRARAGPLHPTESERSTWSSMRPQTRSRTGRVRAPRGPRTAGMPGPAEPSAAPDRGRAGASRRRRVARQSTPPARAARRRWHRPDEDRLAEAAAGRQRGASRR